MRSNAQEGQCCGPPPNRLFRRNQRTHSSQQPLVDSFWGLFSQQNPAASRFRACQSLPNGWNCRVKHATWTWDPSCTPAFNRKQDLQMDTLFGVLIGSQQSNEIHSEARSHSKWVFLQISWRLSRCLVSFWDLKRGVLFLRNSQIWVCVLKCKNVVVLISS